MDQFSTGIPNSSGQQGWRALGEMLGGNIGTPSTYENQMKAMAQYDKAMADARRANYSAINAGAQAGARTALTPDLMVRYAAGEPEAQAVVMASTLGAAPTPNLRNLGNFQRPGYGEFVNRANEAGVLGDIPTANRFNALAQGKPYQPMRVLGDSFVSDGVALGDAVAIPTPESLSRIEWNEARARAATTRANRVPASNRPKSAAVVEAEVVAQARERIAAGADPARVAEYLRSKGYPGAAKKIVR